MFAPVQSLLVVVGRESESQVSLRKAVVLARHLGVRVELFLCESEPVTAASEASAMRILDALRSSIAADDVTIGTGWAGGISLREGVARRLFDHRPSLVLRSISAGAKSGVGRVSPAERELVTGGCQAPLWLARRSAWAPHPRFMVSPDTEAQRCPAWGNSALQLARMLARGARADVEVREGVLADSVDALFLPAPRPGDVVAEARIEGLVERLDCDLVFVPRARTSGDVPAALSARRAAPALSS